MQRSSQQDQDAVVWQTTAIPLGAAGLDLRTPTSPGALTKLLNARFRDESNLERRNGYRGVELQDDSSFANGTLTPDGWVYGHGQTLSGLTESAHHPLPRRGAGLFRYDGTDVAWTGDRLLLLRDDGNPAIGASSFWARTDDPETLSRGIPAYLPVQTDSTPPDVVSGDYADTCVTETLRVVVATASGPDLIAWVIDRTTGAVLNRTPLVDNAAAIYDPYVVSSGGVPVCLWLKDDELFQSYWTGELWTEPSLVSSDCDGYDIQPLEGGFMLLWRTAGDVKVGRYAGHSVDNGDFAFGTTLTLGATTTGAFALAVDQDERFAVVFQDDSDVHLWVKCFTADASDDQSLELLAEAGPYDSGLTACFRGLKSELSDNTRYPLVVHAGNGELYTAIIESDLDDGSGTRTVVATETRYRTHVHSKSFRVGDEVFCWLRARNSETAYLVAGSKNPQVCGIADREAATARAVNNGFRAIPSVCADPLDEFAFTWIRPFTTSRAVTVDDETTEFDETYARAGNARIGDMQFMPRLSAVQYGRSVYLAGSLVRNWDGIELGDAGFHDYPRVEGDAASALEGAGSLTADGSYAFRVYAVRYNRRGERFQSPAITTTTLTLAGAQDTAELQINCVPATNHSDVIFEVYRTEDGGTTFYLDGTIDNSLALEYVTYTSTISDAALRIKLADPHAPGIGVPAELEELGPIGCSTLMTAGDRLWSYGGQVPSGTVQFSKLKEPGEGAGFDVLAGFQEIDVQGAPITSMSAYGEAVICFQENTLQVISADGPDNYGNGSFGVPQMFLTDGATTHLGTALTPIGVVYWGADGPRLLAGNMQVDQICAPVRELSRTLEPSGVQVDLARQEVVWFTESGTALLWNFRSVESKFGQLTSIGRWAQWSAPHTAAVTPYALLTTDGRVLYEDEAAYGDDGVPFAHTGATGFISPGAILGGHTHVRGVGVAGEYLGPHDLRLKVYYDGSPMWEDQWEWDPLENTGLQSGTELGDLDGEDIDALGLVDRSGQYATHKRTSRHTCRHFRVEWSDIGAWRPTYRLHELTLELGARGGFGRVPVNTFR